MSKIITDENQLNTEVDDLITEDYALEVLGLKNPADFRKFSRSFMKLSKIVKDIENVSNKVASKTELGRVKIGDNLTITEDGTLSGNPEYTHPVGAGYKHIPTGGIVGQVLKNNGNGSAEWGNLSLENYYTKPEIDTKFKNLSLVPVPVGGVLAMYNNTNPAELYSGTTWELITSDKYIRTGSTPLSTGGSNSITISKANLPNIKLKVDSHNHTQPQHFHTIEGRYGHGTKEWDKITTSADNTYNQGRTNAGGGENTGSSSPYTETLGSGTALTIQPAYITLKFWKRLT